MEGYFILGGYSYAVVKFIVLWMVVELCLDDFNMEVLGIGGVVQVQDVIEHLLLGVFMV